MKQTIQVLALMIALASPEAVRADEFAQWGRAVHKKHSQAVVTIQLVVKSKLSMAGRAGQSNESRQEVTGTVVDPSGLTVVSLSAVDPGQLVQNLVSDDRIKMESELADVKILMPDGAEVPAEVVLRDKDLDLAFIRPKAKPAQPMQAIDLAQSATAEILDPVTTLNRLGNAGGRSYSASAERVSAIVRRPRLFYIPDANATTTSLGCPAFTADGKVLGIVVMRALKSSSSMGGAAGMQNQNYTAIILPAADVLKAAKQAPAPGQEAK